MAFHILAVRRCVHMKKIQWKNLITAVAIPLATGGLSALLTKKAMDSFEMLNQPPLSPPTWLFPVVWTILYILMGIASYLIATSGQKNDTALTLYGIQLCFNFLWTLIFFNMEWYLFAFLWLIGLWILILLTTIAFYRISKPAAYMMIPYLIWVTFAGYLNYGIYLLN